MHSTLPPQQEHSEPPRTAPHAPPPGGRRPGRVAALDGLRLCAALMVVAYHWMAFGSGAWGAPARAVFPTAHVPASYGWLGVQLFFLISGFVICMSGWGRGLGEFAASRAARLLPAYWFAVLLVSLVVRRWPTVNSAPALRDVAVNLTMLQDPLGVEPVDGVYWTLWIEVRFYLLFALVVAAGLTYRRVLAFCGLWACAALIARATGDDLLRELLLPYDCWYFLAGIAFYLMHRFGPNALLWLITGGSLLIAQHDLVAAQARAESHMGHRVPHWPTPAAARALLPRDVRRGSGLDTAARLALAVHRRGAHLSALSAPRARRLGAHQARRRPGAGARPAARPGGRDADGRLAGARGDRAPAGPQGPRRTAAGDGRSPGRLTARTVRPTDKSWAHGHRTVMKGHG
ncbi:hypothetical protein GCM10020221_08520 [Streptomyces thioluteus]|uniref:Acyltransferase 3 domain-containing protein n=1 Tax=Streptomyces thioluteus TaxID=66431 RepID=A0ABN3WHX8_STRTU